MQELIDDNQFESATITYECFHTLQKNEEKVPNYKYIESDNERTIVIRLLWL